MKKDYIKPLFIKYDYLSEIISLLSGKFSLFEEDEEEIEGVDYSQLFK